MVVYWRELVRALRDRFRIVVPDHVGCGMSEKPRRQSYPYRLDRRIRDLGELVELLDLREITLVGHDWGGAIGMGTAIESPMQVSLALDVIKGEAPKMPRIVTPQRRVSSSTGSVQITTGIGPDLHEACRAAVRGMIDLAGKVHGLSAIDAYMLCSVAGDLRISQIVDAPNWTVSFHLPDSIFSGAK